MGQGTAATARVTASFALIVGAAFSPACDVAQGFADVGGALVNPDAGYLDSPGRKLASGSFRRLLVDGSLDDGGHVIAIRTEEGESEIAVVPYLGGDNCFISPGVAVDRLSSKVDVELDGLIAVQRDDDGSGRGEVSFVNFDCEEVYDSLPQTTLPQIMFPAGNPRGVLSLTAEGDLYLVNLKAGEIELVAQEVVIARTSADTLWTVEGGELVARTSALTEFARTGSGVSQFSIPGGTRMTAAYRDEEGVFIWSEADGAQLISTTGCSVVSWGSETIAFFDPCEESKLNVYTLGSRIGADFEFAHIVGPSDATLIERARTFWGQGGRASEIIFLQTTQSEAGERLLLGRLPTTPKEKDGVFELNVETLADDGAFIRGGQLYEDWTGRHGTLVEQERNDNNRTIGLTPIAERVAQLPGGGPYSRVGILTDYRGEVGTLEKLTKEGEDIERSTIVERVPVQTQTVQQSTKLRAFIGESDDGVTGTLFLYDVGDLETEPKLTRLAENVYTETARFLDQPTGVAYLTREPGAEYAELKVWLLDAGFEITIHKTVSEYRTVPWPAPGILYAVPDGDDQGLWFSKAR